MNAGRSPTGRPFHGFHRGFRCPINNTEHGPLLNECPRSKQLGKRFTGQLESAARKAIDGGSATDVTNAQDGTS